MNAAHGSASDSVLVILMPVMGKQRLLFVTVVSMTEEEEEGKNAVCELRACSF